MTKSLRTIRLAIILATLSVVAGCEHFPRYDPASGVTTTVIMLRHAERPSLGTNLTEAGRERAAALPAAVAKYDIAAIYSPDMVRNLDTVRPLATARGLEIQVINEWDALHHIFSEQPGKISLWVGNTGNLTKMYEEIGATGRPPVGYGDLFIVELRDGKAVKVTESRYGK